MSKKSPAPPDYTAAATAQGAANQATAAQQALLNNPNMVTPYGTSTYGAPGADGRATLTQTLSPAEQAKLAGSDQAQIGALGILNSDMPNVASALAGPFGLNSSAGMMPAGAGGPIQTNLNFSNSPALVGTDEATRQQAQNATYQQGAQYLDPQFKNLQNDVTANLANQGITAGSAAYDRAKLDANNQQQKAYSDLNDTSILAGNQALAQEQAAALANRGQISQETSTAGQFANQAQQQGFNAVLQALQQNNAGQAQNYSQYANNRTMPLNMLNALLSSSQVNNPSFQPTTPTAIQPTPILQGAQLQGQQQAANASANAGKFSSLLGAGAKLGAAYIGA